jgi:hypothetical protein
MALIWASTTAGDDVIFGLEVVIHVAGRYFGPARELGQGGAFDAVFVEQLAGGGQQPIPLA